MLHPKDYFRNLSKKVDRLKQIASPLKDHFGVEYFYYFNIASDGSCFLITTHPEFDEFWLYEKVYVEDPYIRHPSNYQTGLFSLDGNGNEQWEESVSSVLAPSQFCTWGALIKKMRIFLNFSVFVEAKDCRRLFKTPVLDTLDCSMPLLTMRVRN